jgi:hypothetical protein
MFQDYLAGIDSESRAGLIEYNPKKGLPQQLQSSSPTDEPPQHHDLQHQLQQQQHVTPPLKEFLHKTKSIHFLGRTTPIILQNNNGPCPLLAIC